MNEGNDQNRFSILDYLKKWGQDSDKAVRKEAAARLWRIGGADNQAAAEAIWKELGVHPDEIEELKKEYAPKNDNQ